MKIRSCSEADVPVLALLGAATFLESYAGVLDGASVVANCLAGHSPEAWKALMAKQTTRAWLAEIDPGAAPVGYAVVSHEPEFPADVLRAGDAELRRIYAFSRFHGIGVGQALMDRAVEDARAEGAERLLLGVHSDNLRALAFYRRNGFGEVGRRTFSVGTLCFCDPVLAKVL